MANLTTTDVAELLDVEESKVLELLKVDGSDDLLTGKEAAQKLKVLRDSYIKNTLETKKDEWHKRGTRETAENYRQRLATKFGIESKFANDDELFEAISNKQFSEGAKSVPTTKKIDEYSIEELLKIPTIQVLTENIKNEHTKTIHSKLSTIETEFEAYKKSIEQEKIDSVVNAAIKKAVLEGGYALPQGEIEKENSINGFMLYLKAKNRLGVVNNEIVPLNEDGTQVYSEKTGFVKLADLIHKESFWQRHQANPVAGQQANSGNQSATNNGILPAADMKRIIDGFKNQDDLYEFLDKETDVTKAKIIKDAYFASLLQK